jgi:hypothetical protein
MAASAAREFRLPRRRTPIRSPTSHGSSPPASSFDTRTQARPSCVLAMQRPWKLAEIAMPLIPKPKNAGMIAAVIVPSRRRAFRRSTSIARRRAHESIWATHSVLVFALRLLRLGRTAIGSCQPATQYRSRQKAAWAPLQPELAFPSERQVSGQSTNIARRGGHRSISATLSAPVFAPRRPRSSSWLQVPDSGRVAGARRIQRFPIRVEVASAVGPASAQFARKSEG